jgi:hypothetical protein
VSDDVLVIEQRDDMRSFYGGVEMVSVAPVHPIEGLPHWNPNVTASVSEGHCPPCNRRAELRDGWMRCDPCGISWRMTTRPLTSLPGVGQFAALDNSASPMGDREQ